MPTSEEQLNYNCQILYQIYFSISLVPADFISVSEYSPPPSQFFPNPKCLKHDALVVPNPNFVVELQGFTDLNLFAQSNYLPFKTF